MAKLPEPTTTIIFELERRMWDIIYYTTSAKLNIFDRFGETEETIDQLEELDNIVRNTNAVSSRFTTLLLKIAQTQPTLSSEIFNLVEQIIEQAEEIIFVTEGSVQEIIRNWNLP
ncbi:hypothetical protein [Argonema galeatum]|uniref:hypothetical protein n=1 Tax=Argonema galeatum TaxID=2942762 RepID=UPI0020137D3D|nr:hypothetical protein [Argonema galeatum]MCL1468344.1 hypothetical protein [Argonema galeatum A003/A1]